MSKQGNTGKRSNTRIIVTFIVMLILCFAAGYIGGRLTGDADIDRKLENISGAAKSLAARVLPAAFIVVSLSAIIIPSAFFAKCRIMYRKLMNDRGNDDLWDSLEDSLNLPVILSGTFSMVTICLFMCFVYESLISEQYSNGIAVTAFVLFIIAMAAEIIIPYLTLDMEKKLNPEKQGNILDMKFRKVWMDSCDEAERMIAYKSGYKAFLSTNTACIILIVIAFIGAFAFSTGISALVFVFIIWFVNNFSYMLRALRLEKRK